MDAVGKALLQRVSELLAARHDLTRAEFGKRIDRGHSWMSEFLSGARTTDDLRLLIKMSRVFGVSVGYLLGETDRTIDAGAATLLSTWDSASPAARRLLLDLAASLRQNYSSEGLAEERAADSSRSFASTPAIDVEPQRRKR